MKVILKSNGIVAIEDASGNRLIIKSFLYFLDADVFAAQLSELLECSVTKE